ncbi:hypothetical protein A2U01_0042436, partial [Trifolium medium]|nr:hypothetical protein [Trifolium medium]
MLSTNIAFSSGGVMSGIALRITL